MKNGNQPMRHTPNARNRKKALHFAENLLEELQYVDAQLRRLIDEDMRYTIGRAARLLNRVRAEQYADIITDHHPKDGQRVTDNGN